MVDRITPMTTDVDRERLARDFGIVDRSPVMTEPFSAWVIEDQFCDGRPPLDEVGVRFTDDVRPYALVKTRLLNALHLVLGAVGGLAGLSTMGEVMRDPVLRAFADALTRQEIVPALPPTDMDLEAYRRSVLERLANPKMEDQLARLCRAGSQKLPRHVLPSLLAARDEGRPHPLLTLAVAAVCRLHRGVDERGRPFDIDDDAAPRLRALALVGGNDPRALLSELTVFGELGADDAFVAELAAVMTQLGRDGVRATVARSLAPGGSLIA
jgi:fructuronate reductase/mannitol 2-dehydrogenase